MNKSLKIILFLLIVTSFISAQDNPPRVSPKAAVSQIIGYTNVKVVYGRPGVKERKIWGFLVPFNKIWRTGANEATTIEFNRDVKLNGNLVKAGKYSLFTIPNKSEWTIIINKIDEQWGAFKYNNLEDLIRFKIRPEKAVFTERLMFVFTDLKPYSSVLRMNWESLSIPIKIETKLDD